MPPEFEHSHDDLTKGHRPAVDHVAHDGPVHLLEERLAGKAERAGRLRLHSAGPDAAALPSCPMDPATRSREEVIVTNPAPAFSLYQFPVLP